MSDPHQIRNPTDVAVIPYKKVRILTIDDQAAVRNTHMIVDGKVL